ncbi:MAG: nucleotide exchange factor GrpE [Ruminococcaceae bacterium]|nr:nucleotide exchange factor GrpE [Oscillospiraceae bacterium]
MNNEKNGANFENEEIETAADTVTAQEKEKPAGEKPEKATKKKKEKADDAAKKLIADLIAENEKQKSELAEQKDMYLRVLAEYENFRRRTADEKSKIYSDTTAEVVEKFLPVLDNLEHAAVCSTDSDADSAIRQGVELVLRSFREILEKLGVSEIPALGETFDPNIHNAVMREDDPEKGESEITAVFQKGYKLSNKVIRYSMVKVAN